MLVLTRKAGEKILIGSDIEIEILDVRGDAVKIGITAPREVPVWRGELVQAVADANREALAPATLPLEEISRLFKNLAAPDQGKMKKEEDR
ncbi:MAG: carbon storage regulator CsrA [Synergistaceae bacterium]|nr:carbon storage regulator CsrA [Synergistaceae bacterium]